MVSGASGIWVGVLVGMGSLARSMVAEGIDDRSNPSAKARYDSISTSLRMAGWGWLDGAEVLDIREVIDR